MTRKSTMIATLTLWGLALLAIAGLVASQRRGAIGPRPEPTASEVLDPVQIALRESRRIVVVEGPPDDDLQGVTDWDRGLTASAASAIVDNLRSEGFRRALGTDLAAPAVVSRVRTLGPKGRDPSAPVVATLRADALVFVAVRSIRIEPEGPDALITLGDGKGWIRLVGRESGRKLSWDRAGRARIERKPGARSPIFDPGRSKVELAKFWGLGLIGPDLAARLARGPAVAALASPGTTR